MSWRPLATLALALALTVRFAVLHAYSLYDDAYIYFTYAENLARGCGLDFRCEAGAPVEGFTSPLYMLLVLGLRVLSSDLETATLCLGIATLAGSLWLAASAVEQLWLGLAVVLALGLDDFVLLNAVHGLETPLFMFIASGAVWAALRGRGLAGWLALAIWVRPEGLLLMGLGFTARSRRVWIAPVVAAVVLLALRLAYFGDWLPNTYYAKAGGSLAHAHFGWLYITDVVRSFAPIVLAPLALWQARTRAVACASIAAAVVLLASFLRTGGDVFAYGRLFVPLVPALYVCAALGLGALVAKLDLRAGFAAAPLLAWALFSSRAHALVAHHGFANVLQWQAVGRFLGRAHPGARIATVPIGAIAYYSGLHVVDLVGLTSREIARAGRSVPEGMLNANWIGHERHDTEWVLSQAPDLIVLGTKYSHTPLHELSQLRAGFYAEWLLLQLAKQGKIGYRAYTPEIAPGVYWHMLARASR